ncbi:MAG: hypothetical protein GPJ00_05965 [Microcystis aeruginosa W13-18]|nr:hypothetical protein [Microcystis aeruginosa W13-18]NCR35245.1 hypothetical protein [Microcystis aeruginosa S11-05]NCR48750.1 hypothetical protein [Microcystis aeruginosa S11-01]
MRFYLEYINHLGRLQKKSAQLVSLSNHRRPQAGFTITEVLLAGVMMLIAVLVSGIGVINLLRSNYRANADSEIRNNLNRTLEFVSDEVRRAKIIPQREADIVTTQVPEARAAGARAVLAFRIPDPNNPGQPLPNQIVYYTTGPENSLTGPRVLWRFGPDLDPNGNYRTPDQINTWIRSPVTDMLAAAANNPNCPADFNLIAANLGNVDGFYACVGAGGNQVILNANAQVKMTTNDEVRYSVSTRVFPRATCDIVCLTSPTSSGPSSPPPSSPPPSSPPFQNKPGVGATKLTLPVLTVAANVKAEFIQGEPCTFSTSSPQCGVLTAPERDLPRGIPKQDFGSSVPANAGDGIVVYVDGLRNVYDENGTETVVYTSKSSNLPSNINSLSNKQILFVLTSKTNPSTSYQILVTIEPK